LLAVRVGGDEQAGIFMAPQTGRLVRSAVLDATHGRATTVGAGQAAHRKSNVCVVVIPPARGGSVQPVASIGTSSSHGGLIVRPGICRVDLSDRTRNFLPELHEDDPVVLDPAYSSGRNFVRTAVRTKADETVETGGI